MANADLKIPTLHPDNPATRYPSAGPAQAEADFRRRYPEYEQTTKLDEPRATDYARLDRQEHVYLDYTGGGLYAESQVRAHMDLLNNTVFGNPHSSNPTLVAATHLVESARAYVLEYFNASPELRRPWYAGGTITFSSVTSEAAFEDGIVNVCISLGIVSNSSDAYRFMQFAETFVDQPTQEAAQ